MQPLVPEGRVENSPGQSAAPSGKAPQTNPPVLEERNEPTSAFNGVHAIALPHDPAIDMLSRSSV